MADLEVIFDPQKEFAAIVNLDTRMGWGPAMIGPNAGDVLQTFIDATPFDLTIMDGHTANQAFAAFLGLIRRRVAETVSTADPGPLEPSGRGGVDQAALAEHEASQTAGEPPDPQPADTDMEADEGPTMELAACFNCGGTGRLDFGDGEPSVRCNVCQGSGQVEQPVQT